MERKRSIAHKSRARWLATALTTIAVLCGALPATATVIERNTYSGTDTFVVDPGDWCPGIAFDVKQEFRGRVHLRVDRTGQAFLVHDKFWENLVITNHATGKWFTSSTNQLFHDIKATLVDGNVYKFVDIVSGQKFVLSDSTGKVVARNRGVIRETYLWDTFGDFAPGGGFLGFISVVFHGPHPTFTDEVAFCEIATRLTAPSGQ